MIKIIISIALIIIIIMFDNNFFYFNFDKFSVDNKLDRNNKKTVWIYKPADVKSSGLINLCIKSIKRHLGKVCNIVIFNKNDMSVIIPEYMDYLDKCTSEYMFNNMIKYSIIYKYGGIWLPCSTVVVDKFYIDEDPYIDGKLIFFTEKKREHNRYFNRFDFSAIASIKETTQVKYLLDKLKENITTFNYSFEFNKQLESDIDNDSNIHYMPISDNSIISDSLISNNDLINTYPVIKLNKYIKLVFLDIESIKKSPKYSYILNISEKTINESNIFLKTLFEYSNK